MSKIGWIVSITCIEIIFLHINHFLIIGCLCYIHWIHSYRTLASFIRMHILWKSSHITIITIYFNWLHFWNIEGIWILRRLLMIDSKITRRISVCRSTRRFRSNFFSLFWWSWNCFCILFGCTCKIWMLQYLFYWWSLMRCDSNNRFN